MKNIILFVYLLFGICANAQSDIFPEHLISYAKVQNLKIIQADLEKKGFISKLQENTLGAVKPYNSEITSDVFHIMKNRSTSTFSVCYQGSKSKYEDMINYFSSKNIKYSHTSYDTAVYEIVEEKYRLGINDNGKIICIYTRL